MLKLSLVQTFAVWVLPVLFAITLHEAAHALVANLCGDSTAKMLGRLTMNPIKHVDLIGTIILPILIAVLSQFQFIFGYAKPVPINWFQLRNPKRDMAIVAAAGPIANFIMAFVWAACAKIGAIMHPGISKIGLFMFLTGEAGVLINLVLAFLNLLPIPPLDGSRILCSLLPNRLMLQYLKLEPFGLFILVILLFTGILGWILNPMLGWAIDFISLCFNMG